MTHITIELQAFRDVEVVGWETKADGYHHLFDRTRQTRRSANRKRPPFR